MGHTGLHLPTCPEAWLGWAAGPQTVEEAVSGGHGGGRALCFGAFLAAVLGRTMNACFPCTMSYEGFGCALESVSGVMGEGQRGGGGVVKRKSGEGDGNR